MDITDLHEHGLPDASKPAVFAFGDPDDAYRICGALASIARQNTDNAAAIATCHSRNSSWKQRIEAVEEMLDEGALEGVLFIDPDALFPGIVDDASRWSDASMRIERDALFTVLVRGGKRHRWKFIRTLPDNDITALEPVPGDRPEPSPELRPAARWLRERGILRSRSWGDFTQEDIDHVVLAGLADSLDTALETTAMRLALVRPVETINGAVGPYPTSGVSRIVCREHLEDLAARGIVSVRENRFRMPRRFRRHFLALATAMRSFVAAQEHEWLAVRPGTSVPERHFHAIRSGDVLLAIGTSHWYSNDLRLMTFALTAEKRFKEASDIYDFIRISDEKDAYAHEYFGWSLWKHQMWQNDDMEREKILDAYTKAHQLDPGNPLYHGRLLRFRIECGENVLREFVQHVRKMTQESRSESAIKWFTHPVVRIFKSRSKTEDLKSLEDTFGKTLVRSWLSRPFGKSDVEF